MRSIIKHWIVIVFTAVTLSSNAQHKKALLVIDVQENLLKPESKMHMDTTKITSFLTNVNSSISTFKKQGLPILYTINEFTNPFANFVTGKVCKKGAKGTGIDNNVNVTGTEIFHKSRKNAFGNKKLLKFLRDNSIDEVYIVGLFGEFCVKGSVKGGLKDKFKVFVIEDAVGSKNEKRKLRSINSCKIMGATIVKSNELNF